MRALLDRRLAGFESEGSNWNLDAWRARPYAVSRLRASDNYFDGVYPTSLEFLRHGGRIGSAKSLIAGLLGLRPIIADKDGKIVPVASARGDAEANERAIALVKNESGQGQRVRLGLVEMGTSGASGALERAKSQLTQSFDVVGLIRAPATGVVGVHTGPGAWGLLPARQKRRPICLI